MKTKNIHDWNLNFILELLKKGYNEDIWFDFKQSLPHPKDDDGKIRLRKTVASFANNEGGFIVFGILDDKAASPENRLKGIAPNEDYPVLLGNLLENLMPRPNFTLKNPPIFLSSGNLIHVCEIFESMDKPVSVEVKEGAFTFPLRTSKGTASMRYDEIKQNFLGYAYMRDKLLLLVEELKRIIQELKLFEGAPNLSSRDIIPGNTIAHETLSLCIFHAHGLLKKETHLLYKLNDFKTRIGLINGDIMYNLSRFSADEIGRRRFIEEANKKLAGIAGDMKRDIEQFLPEVESFIEKI